MGNSNRFDANKKNKGQLTIKLSDEDWFKLKLLVNFLGVSPSVVISMLLNSIQDEE
jgi:hypothetical protein